MMRWAWLVSILMTGAHAQGATLTVGPNLGFDYSTLTEAMWNASSGDVILLSSGTYEAAIGESFPISVRGGVTVRPLASGARPVFRGSGNSALFLLQGARDVTLENLSFTQGGGPQEGGGIRMIHASAVIRDCTFHENTLIQRGGAGLYAFESEVVLERCTFSGNSIIARDIAQSGGGAQMRHSDFEIRDCSFLSNRVVGETGAGGGLFTAGGGGVIERCDFRGNIAGSFGGGLWVDGSDDLVISDCLFVMNSAGSTGGGAMVFYTAAEIRNCKFYSNGALGSTGGGGMLVDGFRTAPYLIDNCRFVGNRGTWAGSIRCMQSSQVEISNCISVGNRGAAAGGFTSDSGSVVSVQSSTLARNEPAGAAASLSGILRLSDCFFDGNQSLQVQSIAAAGVIEATNNLFFGSEGGVLADGLAIHSSIEEVESAFPSWTQNREVDPLLQPAPSGVWTHPPVHIFENHWSVLRDDNANWTPGQFANDRFTVNPNTSQVFHSAIVSNTSRTLTVWGNPTDYTRAGDTYSILDLRMKGSSPLVDAGSATGPDADYFGSPRPVDIPLRGRDGTGDAFDIGAIELQEETSFGESADLDGDGKVDSKDLLKLLEAFGERRR